MRIWRVLCSFAALMGTAGCEGGPLAVDDELDGSSSTTFLPNADEPGSDTTANSRTLVDPEDVACDPDLRIQSALGIEGLAGVVVHTGSLSLYDLSDGDLSRLRCLEEVGDLSIRNSPGLTSLDGLRNLRRVEGVLQLRWNDSLEDVGGLSGLREVGEVQLWNNASLRDVDGLAGVQTFGGLDLQVNPRLETLVLPDVEELGGLSLYGNRSLTRVQLPSLRRVDGRVKIERSDSLADLDGLGRLEEITGDLSIEETPLLASTAGFASLRAVGGALRVSETPGLTRIDFPAVERLGEMSIRDQEALEAIDLPALRELGTLVLLRLPALTGVPDLVDSKGLHELVIADLPLLASLDWARRLEPAVDSVTIHGAPLLADLSPLATMTKASGHVRISNLPALTTLDELAALTAVDGTLSLSDLPGISDVDGLGSLHTAGSPESHLPGGLFIRNCDSVSSLAGLASLTAVENLSITDNDAITALVGLHGLSAVAGSVTIASNPHLHSLDGLDNLQTIAEGLTLTDNAALTDIDAIWPQPLGVLLTVGEPQLTIRGNTLLSQCVVDEFVAALINAGWLALADTGDNLACR